MRLQIASARCFARGVGLAACQQLAERARRISVLDLPCDRPLLDTGEQRVDLRGAHGLARERLRREAGGIGGSVFARRTPIDQ